MKFHFNIHYRTTLGQQLAIQYWDTENKAQQLLLNSHDGAHWSGLLSCKQSGDFNYQYQVITAEETLTEYGAKRKLSLTSTVKNYYLRDQWKARSNKKHIFNRSAFKNILLKRPTAKKSTANSSRSKRANSIKFSLYSPDTPNTVAIGIVGNQTALGQWEKPILLSSTSFPNWETEIAFATDHVHLEYKYVLCSLADGSIVDWEHGDNHVLHHNFDLKEKSQLVISQEGFRYAQPWWRAAGLAIPVFSLRSERGLGIGEFSDLLPLIDFSVMAGLKMIQVLPVNDTLALMNWQDSYPYAAISVFALHPLYINIPKVGSFKNKKDLTAYSKAQEKLNKLAQIDFEAVLEHKFNFLTILYHQHKKKVFSSAAFKKFFAQNEHWLIPYAAFCYLRDIYETPDFNSWPEHSSYDEDLIQAMCSPDSVAYDKIAFYYFLQFHADRQLKEVRSYGEQKGIVLKGDLPIGIYRYSSDAWVAPQLYNMTEQAGAPPDDYAVLGQNWGFPTYDWQEMAKDNFKWWRSRMQQLAVYFDALRIDHILGFFRIWQIPIDQVFGTMGLFNPRLPYSTEELAQYNFTKPISSYTKPYISAESLKQTFGKEIKWLVKTFLKAGKNKEYEFKSAFKTQVQIQSYFKSSVSEKHLPLLPKVLQLATEVLLIEEPGSAGKKFNPRITLNKTTAYKNLNDHDRECFDRLYHDYYHVRHDDFWKSQAYWKLPALIDATNMFICGEDLGMIPASVPGVMDQLNIAALEIQRMSKSHSQFGQPSSYPYFAVCSPSCHDMSTIRGWWEGDPAIAQQFYNNHWQQAGEAPKVCSADLVQRINLEHFDSPAMLSIFPIQDLLGMVDRLKRKDAFAEQINEPSNSKHYWRYRLHLNIEQLLEEKEFIAMISRMVKLGGR